MRNFDGKIAVVTGGSSGIGRATSLALAKEGATVIVNYHADDEKARETLCLLESSGVKGYLMKADIRDYAALVKGMEDAASRHGKIDFLVNNAGIVRDKTLKKMELPDWNEVIATNLTGVFHCCKAASNFMNLREGSRIVIISSLVGEEGNFGQVNYAAAKAGLIGFSKSLAKEMAHYKVTVNAIAPGFTRTDMLSKVPSEILDKLILQIPLRRFAEPTEIAHAVLYLCSPEAGFITGSVLDINGGMHL